MRSVPVVPRMLRAACEHARVVERAIVRDDGVTLVGERGVAHREVRISNQGITNRRGLLKVSMRNPNCRRNFCLLALAAVARSGRVAPLHRCRLRQLPSHDRANRRQGEQQRARPGSEGHWGGRWPVQAVLAAQRRRAAEIARRELRSGASELHRGAARCLGCLSSYAHGFVVSPRRQVLRSYHLPICASRAPLSGRRGRPYLINDPTATVPRVP